MQVPEDNLARILGNIESNLSNLVESSKKHEASLLRMENTFTKRIDDHDQRLRELEISNPSAMAEALKNHHERISSLEKSSARAGALAGLGSSVLVAGLIEYVKHKIGS